MKDVILEFVEFIMYFIFFYYLSHLDALSGFAFIFALIFTRIKRVDKKC